MRLSRDGDKRRDREITGRRTAAVKADAHGLEVSLPGLPPRHARQAAIARARPLASLLDATPEGLAYLRGDAKSRTALPCGVTAENSDGAHGTAFPFCGGTEGLKSSSLQRRVSQLSVPPEPSEKHYNLDRLSRFATNSSLAGSRCTASKAV